MKWLTLLQVYLMTLEPLTAISPIDGRYRNKSEFIANYFSEYALIKYRLIVEIEYFLALTRIPLPQLIHFPETHAAILRRMPETFSVSEASRIKQIEHEINHDVKAIEYYLKERFDQYGWHQYAEWIHFGLTSQDINNTAIPLSLKDFFVSEYLPRLKELIEELDRISEAYDQLPMLARTHGQPASPTRLGKEIKVFVERLNDQVAMLQNIPFTGKFGGATGNFNAHHAAFPNIDWKQFANELYQTLGLRRQQYTTQIEHYDFLAAFLDNLRRINIILIDLCRDIWTYISMEYFSQTINPKEVGSSAMPHKVNPIDFENAEGNLGLANALFHHLAEKLPVSRLQRDLTDSTVIRNLGVPMAHTIISFEAIKKGLNKLSANHSKIEADLDNHWEVISEAIQTILRREGYQQPYEQLKALTRTNDKITKQIIHDFIDTLNIDDSIKRELKNITPFNYTGI